MQDEIGTVSVGKLADFVVVGENPLKNLKVLYGTGAIRLTEDNKVIRSGGVRYTIKDGVIYDAQALLSDVRARVEREKGESGYKLRQPGVRD
jgi:imidazolonepropionase-like amidohydrolase